MLGLLFEDFIKLVSSTLSRIVWTMSGATTVNAERLARQLSTSTCIQVTSLIICKIFGWYFNKTFQTRQKRSAS